MFVTLSLTIFASSTRLHKDFVYKTRDDYFLMKVQCTEISGTFFDVFNFNIASSLKICTYIDGKKTT